MVTGAATKSPGAYRTIGEVTAATGVPAHVLRYWEARFPQLRPLTRAGGRRYYRPEDIALVSRIRTLLDTQGYTIRGVQQLLAHDTNTAATPPAPVDVPPACDRATIAAIRDLLRDALATDG